MTHADSGVTGRGEARDAVLGEVRAQLSRSVTRLDTPAAPHQGVAPVPVPATGSGAVTVADVMAFKAAIEAVVGHCTLVSSVAEAARAVGAVLEAHQAARVAISDAPLAQEVARLTGAADRATPLDAASLFDADVGITCAQWGIVETGTLVLAGGLERNRLASLVPPVHVALLRAGDLRRTLGEVLAELGEDRRAALGHCVTFITGPSRTSDIELTLAIGVHGPTELHVVVLGEPQP